ncbi:hypothetical protein V6N11_037513 [Hibiscus sabdariffa]|uniref:Uncharacterized protein n=1 Tax=Hibiscus sabdariffa TaxID=183260 RepID=A0ABR2P1P6_9ROSI
MFPNSNVIFSWIGYRHSHLLKMGMKSALFRIVDDKRDDVGPLEKFLQLFPLDMRFHLHDLVGSDHLKTAHTPTSVVVRFSNDLI